VFLIGFSTPLQAFFHQLRDLGRLDPQKAFPLSKDFAGGILTVNAVAGHANHPVLWTGWHEAFVSPLLSKKGNRWYLQCHRQVQHA
jgi:hypothetical protein